MHFRTNHVLPILLMLLLAGLTLWLRFAAEAPQRSSGARNHHDPDSIVENFTMRKYARSGAPEYLLSAKKMFHYPDSDSIELQSPTFLRVGEDGGRMTVSARNGKISHDASEATFRGNVILRREAMAGSPEMTALTEELEILAAKDLIRTSQAVQLRDGPSQLSGTGMEFNRRTRQFAIHSQAKGTYRAPAQK